MDSTLQFEVDQIYRIIQKRAAGRCNNCMYSKKDLDLHNPTGRRIYYSCGNCIGWIDDVSEKLIAYLKNGKI